MLPALLHGIATLTAAMPTPLNSSRSVSVTFVYAVGLEHTGHHLWHGSASALGLYPSASKFLTSISSEYEIRQALRGRAPTPEDHEHYVRELARQFKVEDYTRRAAGRDAAVGIISCSYPCGKKGEVGNPLRYPDPLSIATAANAAGVTLRLLVLLRPPVEIVSFFKLERISLLADACMRMQFHLERLSLEGTAIIYIPYHETINLAGEISDFLEVNLVKIILQRFRLTTHQDLSLQKLQQSGLHKSSAWQRLLSCSAVLYSMAGLCNRTSTPQSCFTEYGVPWG